MIEKFSSYFAVPVVGGGFVELLPQLEGDLCVFEGALGADHHLVTLLADDHGRFGHVADLPGGETHAWDTRGNKAHVNTKGTKEKDQSKRREHRTDRALSCNHQNSRSPPVSRLHRRRRPW